MGKMCYFFQMSRKQIPVDSFMNPNYFSVLWNTSGVKTLILVVSFDFSVILNHLFFFLECFYTNFIHVFLRFMRFGRMNQYNENSVQYILYGLKPPLFFFVKSWDAQQTGGAKHGPAFVKCLRQLAKWGAAVSQILMSLSIGSDVFFVKGLLVPHGRWNKSFEFWTHCTQIYWTSGWVVDNERV